MLVSISRQQPAVSSMVQDGSERTRLVRSPGLRNFAPKASANSAQSSSEHTLRESADNNVNMQLSVVTNSIASYVSCAPTLTLSPHGSPKPRRNSARKNSTGSSLSSDCFHFPEDASVRGTIGHSDDEDDSVSHKPPVNDAVVRRNHSLTIESRRQVVSLHMPSTAAYLPSSTDNKVNDSAARSNGSAEAASHNYTASATNCKSDETRCEKESRLAAARGQKHAARRLLASQSNAAAFRQPASRLNFANNQLQTPSSTPNATEETVLGVGVSTAPMDDGHKAPASSNDRLTTSPSAPQNANDKLLLPDKKMFARKSHWSSESTLNVLPKSYMATSHSYFLNTPRGLPQPVGRVHSNIPVAKAAVKANSLEEAASPFEQSHNSSNSPSGPLPVRVSQVQQPLKTDNPEKSTRNSLLSSSALARHSRSKVLPFQPFSIVTPLQYEPSATSSTLTTTATNVDETDIDVGWDELSGMASDNNGNNLLRRTASRPVQSAAQVELIGVVESYEMYLNELEVITRKERQQFDLVRNGDISAECWRETAKKILQFKVATIEQMRRLLE